MNKAILYTLRFILPALFAANLSFAAAEKTAAVNPVAEKRAEVVPAKAPAVELLDINSASAEQLKKVLGIGDESAKKIIAGRPYVKKDQLKSRKIISANFYYKIKDRIIARQPKIAVIKK